jgi:predicted RNA binding protein YcfA (HicA-like mRNA interferase family)
MSKKQKILKQILSGSKNISFKDIVTVVEAFGFTLSRVNGSHHNFYSSQHS